jgi:peptidoglycan L-alanyl-D-glutamate endopeptidase CwlK
MCQQLDEQLDDKHYIVFEGLRTKAVQEAYYAQGREILSEVNRRRAEASLYLLHLERDNRIITWTLKSKHLEGLACDILPLTPQGTPTWDLAHYRAQFETIRGTAHKCGPECGADWQGQEDWPHYQVRN